MLKSKKHKIIAKPFVKWAGGKGALIKELVSYLPDDFEHQQEITYVEPFVGGGAMLFYVLTHFPNVTKAIINDVNSDLINCYLFIKNEPIRLITLLRNIHEEYYERKTLEAKADYYYSLREEYNNSDLSLLERAAYLMFLNKTCFNGLYRVNANGKFNVPFGRYKKPNICDERLIMADHQILQKVDIYVGEYSELPIEVNDNYCFIYIDPPYRPISDSSSFIEYTHKMFDDAEQVKLKELCDELTERGCIIMQSNSNSMDEDGESYFAKLYDLYRIEHIMAYRFINAYAKKREKETELLIMNY